jgi:hypothetical protein
LEELKPLPGLLEFCIENPFQKEDDESFVGTGNLFAAKECVYKGKWFPTMTEAAEHFGVTIGAVSLYVSRQGCHRYDMPIEHKGIIYESIRECARITGEPYSTVSNWVCRHNSYLQND